MNNAWNFNGNNRMLNNNNVNNSNQCGAVSNLLHTFMTDEKFFSILLDAMYNARRNKRYGRDCAEFEANWAPLLVRMMRQLKERTFRIDKNYAFLTSVPRWREIFATYFEGRIADHLLCDTLSPYIAQELHPRTFNNRKGMGAQAAINQVIDDIYDVTDGYRAPARIIKWDLKGFFPNARLAEIERRFNDVITKYSAEIEERFDAEMPAFLKWLAMVCIHCCPAEHCELRTPKILWRKFIPKEKSLFGKPEGIGAPIGRLTSQIGMGLYLNDEVVWLNEVCGIRTTVFMDDGVMVVPESLHGYALALFPILRLRLGAKGIKLNETKFYDQPFWRGAEFLGSHIRPFRVHINNKTYARATGRVMEYNALADRSVNIDHFLSSVNSYTGLLKNRTDYGRTAALRNLIDSGWWEMLRWDERRQCLVFKKAFSRTQRLNRKYHLKLKHYDKSRNHRSN